MKKNLLFSITSCCFIFSSMLNAAGLPPSVAQKSKKTTSLKIMPLQMPNEPKAPELTTFVTKETQGLKKGTQQYDLALKKANENFKRAHQKYLSETSRPAAPAKAFPIDPNGKPSSDLNGAILEQPKSMPAPIKK